MQSELEGLLLTPATLLRMSSYSASSSTSSVLKLPTCQKVGRVRYQGHLSVIWAKGSWTDHVMCSTCGLIGRLNTSSRHWG